MGQLRGIVSVSTVARLGQEMKSVKFEPSWNNRASTIVFRNILYLPRWQCQGLSKNHAMDGGTLASLGRVHGSSCGARRPLFALI